MINHKLIKRTIRFVLNFSDCALNVAFQVTMNEGKLETLSRMTSTPTVDDDFSSVSLTSFFFYCSKSTENAVGVNCTPAETEKVRTQTREETGERRGGARHSLARLQFPTLLCLPHYLRAWNRH